MSPLFDLAINLPPRGTRELLRVLHRELRAAILDGRLQPGMRFPATRNLAAALGISRNTVVGAYDLLLSEGYLFTRPGAGTFVVDFLSKPAQRNYPQINPEQDTRLSPMWHAPSRLLKINIQGDYRFDFRPGLPDQEIFPFQIWRRLSDRALRALSKRPAAYAEPEGQLALREAIVKHISFTRAVACRPEDILITAGAQQAFDFLARALVIPSQTVVAVEEPGYPPLRSVFATAGANIVEIPVDGEGLMVDRLPPNVNVICVTPSHQFPLGVPLSLSRRTALLNFAYTQKAVIIEDDYDGEFRYGGKPLDALQTLDRGDVVFYIGTFSKSMFPALRLGFMVVPPWAKNALFAVKQLADWHSPVLMQDTLATFISEGHLARHIRKMRKIYSERREILLHALKHHCGNHLLLPIGVQAGLHFAAYLADLIPAATLAIEAQNAGIGLHPLKRYSSINSKLNGVIFGYGMIHRNHIDDAIQHLAQLINRIRKK